MNTKTELKSLKGKTYCMSYYGASELDAAKEKYGKDAEITTDMLPRETVGNVVLNCLINYKPSDTDRKEAFEVMRLANWVNDESEGKPELDEKLKTLLVKKVLPYSMITDDHAEEQKPELKKKPKGIYPYWVIVQIYQALGITE